MIAYPGREPSADIAATGDGREIIEFLEHVSARQRLQYAKAKACAADAAAGKAKRGAFRFQRVNPRIDRTEPGVSFRFRIRLRGGRADFAIEFLFENVRERFRRCL